jgi:hypothetical protein
MTIKLHMQGPQNFLAPKYVSKHVRVLKHQASLKTHQKGRKTVIPISQLSVMALRHAVKLMQAYSFDKPLTPEGSEGSVSRNCHFIPGQVLPGKVTYRG